MKIYTLRFLAVAAILFVAGYTVSADNAAVVIKDFRCAMLDGDGNFVFTDETHSVVTSSGNGKVTCKVDNVPNSTGKAVHWNFENTGLQCGTFAGPTEQWKETVSASGQATLSCHVNPGNP